MFNCIQDRRLGRPCKIFLSYFVLLSFSYLYLLPRFSFLIDDMKFFSNMSQYHCIHVSFHGVESSSTDGRGEAPYHDCHVLEAKADASANILLYKVKTVKKTPININNEYRAEHADKSKAVAHLTTTKA